MRSQGVFSTYIRAAERAPFLSKDSALQMLALNEVFLLYLLVRWSDVVPLDVDVSMAHRKGEAFYGHSYKDARRAMEAMVPWKGSEQ